MGAFFGLCYLIISDSIEIVLLGNAKNAGDFGSKFI